MEIHKQIVFIHHQLLHLVVRKHLVEYLQHHLLQYGGEPAPWLMAVLVREDMAIQTQELIMIMIMVLAAAAVGTVAVEHLTLELAEEVLVI